MLIHSLSQDSQYIKPAALEPGERRRMPETIGCVKGKALLIGSIAILTAIAVAGLSFLRENNKAEPAPAAAAAPIQATEVSVPAILQALTVVEVGVPIEGSIQEFHAEVGDEVYEGQLLAQVRSQTLRTAEESAALDLEKMQERVNNLETSISATRLEASRASADAMRARSELDRASRNYDREKMLLAEGATPRLKFEKAERDFATLQTESKNLDELAKQADERVGILQRELDATKKTLQDKSDEMESAKAQIAAGDILAPVNGMITGRRGQPGEEVNPTMKDLFRIATDLTAMSAIAEPGPADLARIKEGQEAFVALAESPDELLPGVVTKIAGGKVTIEFKNPNPAIRPGLTAQVRIRLS
jgi:multidrug resistance efflux pump